MNKWLQIEIPEKFMGEEQTIGNDYIKTYRAEILLPKNSEYVGYYFLHPSKLISFGLHTIKITYNDTFTFTLIKKDREPGKRYKRYVLTAQELVAIYSPETEKLKTRLAKKEQDRLAQVGAVEVLGCRNHRNYFWAVVFHYGKKQYIANGTEFPYRDEVYKSKVVANSVSRKEFEAIYSKLESICEEYRIIQSVRLTLNQETSPHSSDKAVSIYSSFYALSDEWEEEFYQKLSAVFEPKA